MNADSKPPHMDPMTLAEVRELLDAAMPDDTFRGTLRIHIPGSDIPGTIIHRVLATLAAWAPQIEKLGSQATLAPEAEKGDGFTPKLIQVSKVRMGMLWHGHPGWHEITEVRVSDLADDILISWQQGPKGYGVGIPADAMVMVGVR